MILQVGFFKVTEVTGTGKRIFRMAPLHHHFELLGWEQVTVVIRFWIITGLCVAAGLGIFYAEWVGGRMNARRRLPRAGTTTGPASAPSSPASASPASPPPTTSPTSARR